MKSKMITHLKLFFSILLALGLPFLLLLAMPEAQRESIEINMGMVGIGIVLALFVGERHLNRHWKGNEKRA